MADKSSEFWLLCQVECLHVYIILGRRERRKEEGWEETRMRKMAITTVRVWHEPIIIINLSSKEKEKSDYSLLLLINFWGISPQ